MFTVFEAKGYISDPVGDRTGIGQWNRFQIIWLRLSSAQKVTKTTLDCEAIGQRHEILDNPAYGRIDRLQINVLENGLPVSFEVWVVNEPARWRERLHLAGFLFVV